MQGVGLDDLVVPLYGFMISRQTFSLIPLDEQLCRIAELEVWEEHCLNVFQLESFSVALIRSIEWSP